MNEERQMTLIAFVHFVCFDNYLIRFTSDKAKKVLLRKSFRGFLYSFSIRLMRCYITKLHSKDKEEDLGNKMYNLLKKYPHI